MVRTVGEDDSERKVLEDIESFGWHCVHVMAEGDLVEYAFTVGLFHSFKHPDLIVFGLPKTIAHQILCMRLMRPRQERRLIFRATRKRC